METEDIMLVTVNN